MPIRDPLRLKDTQRPRVKTWKKRFHENGGKKAGKIILISDKIDFKIKAITRDKEVPRNSNSGYLSKETQNINSKDISTPMFIAALFTTANQYMEATPVSINRLTDKEDVVNTYNRILLSHKK